ncbi:AAA family ATPase [[Acholeplasma] multilocale]|uniref:AAA family ATPase n=1 Tax=[Acholeplasma] multilocale TaxID=264638 RepID=UPI00047BC354|nr:AAA family ATPase [[Acholeplasma] multilocale]
MTEKTYRISQIRFKNYKNFKDEQVLDFKTNNRFTNTYEPDLVEWSSTKKDYYNPIIAILGANASGKSNLVELFFRYKNFIIDAFTLDLNNESGRDSFDSFDTFNDIDKTLIFEIDYETEMLDFTHNIYTEFDRKLNKFFVREKIQLNRVKKFPDMSGVVIWDFDEREYNSNLSQVKFFITKQMMVEFLNEQKPKEELKNVESLDEVIASEVFNVLTSMVKNTLVSNQTTLDSSSIDKINESINQLIFSGVPLNKVEEIVNYAASTVDASIEKISLKEVKKGIDTFYILDNTKLKNNDKVSFYAGTILSNGTINFIDHILSTVLVKNADDRKMHTYIFMDELGATWHSGLTKAYIKMFQMGIIEDSTIIFTSHQPEVVDDIRRDGVYIINKSSQFKKVTEYKFRNEMKLSKNYSSQNLDPFDAFPDLSGIANLVEVFDE